MRAPWPALRAHSRPPPSPTHAPGGRRLVAAHPGVLTDDIAARFVVGLGPDKAYTGMRSMVDWVSRWAGALCALCALCAVGAGP